MIDAPDRKDPRFPPDKEPIAAKAIADRLDALGSGAEMLQALAIAVIGGLMVALLLSLIVTPTVYAMLRRS